MIDDSRRIAEIASDEGITLCYEFHRDTLTDSAGSTKRLLESVNHPAMRTYWQPRAEQTVLRNLRDLRAVLPWLVNVHAFWWTARGERRPLREGWSDWRHFLDIVRLAGDDRWVLVEFVRGDSPEAFLEDARTLRQWLNDIF
ncbi:MAG: hypothetical protein KatS3mg022_3375 [Armatimonadota bacterium]|nr:MAG: hypothetical protein KatS3mg022_3375 [Armatimonadota bacterium]